MYSESTLNWKDSIPVRNIKHLRQSIVYQLCIAAFRQEETTAIIELLQKHVVSV